MTTTVGTLPFAVSSTAPATTVPLPFAPSRGRIWISRTLSGLAMAFLLFDSALKLARVPVAVEGTASMGFPRHSVVGIGLVLLTCVIVHIVPRTAILGAVLLTGYLGGAVAAHVRLGNPLATHVLFPIYVAALIWGGLALRDRRVRACLASIR
jgi:hypothetical protein